MKYVIWLMLIIYISLLVGKKGVEWLLTDDGSCCWLLCYACLWGKLKHINMKLCHSVYNERRTRTTALKSSCTCPIHTEHHTCTQYLYCRYTHKEERQFDKYLLCMQLAQSAGKGRFHDGEEEKLDNICIVFPSSLYLRRIPAPHVYGKLQSQSYKILLTIMLCFFFFRSFISFPIVKKHIYIYIYTVSKVLLRRQRRCVSITRQNAYVRHEAARWRSRNIVQAFCTTFLHHL